MIEVSEIVVHEAHEPNMFTDLGADLQQARETLQRRRGRLMALKQSKLYSLLGQSCDELSDGMQDYP